MKVLLDENLPRGLQHELEGHEVASVQELGWSGLGDEVLLIRAGKRFDAFVTADRNLEFQQNVAAAEVGIIIGQRIILAFRPSAR